jgi:hypothetical protein
MDQDDRLHRVMSGEDIGQVLYVPKIWVDLAANLMGLDLCVVIEDPRLAMQVILDAGLLAGADAVRQFILPPRRTARDGDKVYEVDAAGRRLGEIDMLGGLATHLLDPADFRIDDPFCMAHQNFWKASRPFVADSTDVARMAIPDRRFYADTGYGALLHEMQGRAAGQIALIGDCDAATLAFCAGLRGVEQVLMDFYENPRLLHALMEKGAERSIERGKFNIDAGLRVLRLNDSMGTISLISPRHWREFIFPHMKTVVDELHHYCPDVRIYCHICGNVLPVMELLVQMGLDCIAPLDPLGGFTVRQARQAVGDQVVLMGGINTVSFFQADVAHVAAEAQRCIEEGQVAGGRFILGSGCAAPRATPLANLRVAAAVAHGEYITCV